MLHKKKIFIASSKEAVDNYAVKKLIETLQQVIKNSAGIDGESFEIISWDKTEWKNFRSTVDNLDQLLPKFSYAIFLFNPDDNVTIRNKQFTIPRDNVVFELGLFLSHLGIDRTFVITPKTLDNPDVSFRLLTDIIGIFQSGSFSWVNTPTGPEFEFEINNIVRSIIIEETKYIVDANRAEMILKAKTGELNNQVEDTSLSPQLLLGTLQKSIVPLIRFKALAQDQTENDVLSDLYILLGQISEICNTSQLISEQSHTKVNEVWVFSDKPVEFLGTPLFRELQQQIIHNLDQGVSYVYFVPHTYSNKSVNGFVKVIESFIKDQSSKISKAAFSNRKKKIIDKIKIIKVNPSLFTTVFTIHHLKESGNLAYMSVVTPTREDIYIKLENTRTEGLLKVLNSLKGEEEHSSEDGIKIISYHHNY